MRKRLRIFIASSSKYVVKNEKGAIDTEKSDDGDLKPIIEGLESAGFEPVPWWRYFSDTNYVQFHEPTLQNLIRASKVLDGGVFIFSEDIQIKTSEESTDDKYVPKANVVLELGMFYASKSVQKTFLIYDGDFEHLEIPSDMYGYQLETIEGNSEFWKNKFSNFFGKSKDDYKYDKVTFYIGSDIVRKKIEGEYKNWKSKALYIGTKSAKLWDQIEGHDGYNKNIEIVDNFIEDCLDKVNFRRLDNVISLGPGNGKTDIHLINALKKQNDKICYIPVDINPTMAFQAAQTVGKKIRVPFAIIDDFEVETHREQDHLKKIINGKMHEIGESNLFVMLGVTFSNLEGTEENIFDRIKGWMDQDDYFLLDVIINNENGKDEETACEELKYKLINEGKNKPNYKNLLINASIKKYLNNNNFNDREFSFSIDFVNELQSNFENYFSIKPADLPHIYTTTKQTLVLIGNLIKDNKKAPLLVVKSYDFNQIKSKIAEHFVIEEELNGQAKFNEPRGFFLLKKKTEFYTYE